MATTGNSLASLLFLPQNSTDSTTALSGMEAQAQAYTGAVTNYDSASAATKLNEAVSKMQGSGELGNFSSLNKQVDLQEDNGGYLATDAASGEPLAIVGDAPASGTQASAAGSSGEDKTAEYKVVITSEPALNDDADRVEFKVMPTISETQSVQYDSFTPLHHPGEIMKYKGTSARSWTVSAKLISRTKSEASANLVSMNTIRAWTMPFYGQGTAKAAATTKFLGAPPPVLTLAAYGGKMIGPVKCILESYSWDFPNDIDYISTDDGVPFPVVLSVTLQLKEAWSPAEFSGFSISEYRKGNLPAAFAAIKDQQAANANAQTAVGTGATTDPGRVDSSQPQSASGPTTSVGGVNNNAQQIFQRGE